MPPAGNGPVSQPIGHNHALVVILRPESGGAPIDSRSISVTIRGTAHPQQIVALVLDRASDGPRFVGHAALPARDAYHFTVHVLPPGGGPAVTATFVHRQLQP